MSRAEIPWKKIYENLRMVLSEMKMQPEIKLFDQVEWASYDETCKQIQEFIDVGECGLAYEYIVGHLEMFPYQLTGSCAIKLLEVGLLMGFKTEQEQDLIYDRRAKE